MALNKQRDCEGVPDGVGPVVQRRESAPISGASLEALLQEGQLTSSVVAEMSKTQAGSKLLQKKLLKAHPSVIQDRGLDVVVALLVVAKITFSVSLACCVLFLLPPFPEKGALGHDMGVKQGGRVWLIPAGPSWSGVWPRSASEDSDPTDQSQDILEGLEAELPEIMCNMYGNYLCSAAFQSCSVAQRLRMLEISSRNLLMIAKDRWGTHAMQSLLSLVCTNDEQRILLLALKEHAVELSLDQHGSHVVQRAIISLGTPCPWPQTRRRRR
eukprot:g27041.t1